MISHPRLTMSMNMADALMMTGARLAFEAADAAKRLKKKKVGATLRPGEGTPLWNALVEELREEANAYGNKARLARVLGVDRQTINAWLTSRTRMPDAERTLQLLAWLLAKRAGQEPV